MRRETDRLPPRPAPGSTRKNGRGNSGEKGSMPQKGTLSKEGEASSPRAEKDLFGPKEPPDSVSYLHELQAAERGRQSPSREKESSPPWLLEREKEFYRRRRSCQASRQGRDLLLARKKKSRSEERKISQAWELLAFREALLPLPGKRWRKS